ncbi:MAG: GNAT family N-acetyltransferase [Oscillospiraceae bacterium]|nr:GNAT family N-acetyltransferase [Oscillospiraceae bacterium]
MGLVVRLAVPEDEERIRELFIEMLQTIYHTENVQGYENGYLDRFWSDNEDRIYVAADSSIEAFLSVEVYREPDNYIYLDDCSVTERYRSRGLGTRLIREAEAYAKERGMFILLDGSDRCSGPFNSGRFTEDFNLQKRFHTAGGSQ